MSAFISRVALRPEGAARFRHWLASGAYGEHQLLWQLFPQGGRTPFLYRWFEPQSPAFLVSWAAPLREHPAWRVESKPYTPQLRAGERLAFVLRANATVFREGRRHDIVMDARAHGDGRPRLEVANDLGLTWLSRQAERHGFALEETQITYYGQLRARGISLGVMDYEGKLRVTDPKAFALALVQGVGRARRFGCGLLLVRRT